MRLSRNEIEAIRSCARRAFGSDAVVRLFGSRVHDDLRGGDIDLHVEVGPEGRADLRAELEFLSRLKGEIGEQRVDVVVRRRGATPSAIDEIALQDGVVL